jgi:macrolide-specific efflux system membrane fusion protein
MRLRTLVLSIGVLVVGAATAGAWYWGRSGSATQNYITAPVTRGDLEVTVTATGMLQPAQYVDVGTQVSGQLQDMPVHVGDVVRKGQMVAQIDRTTIAAKVAADRASIANFQAQRGQAHAKLESLQAQLRQARAKLEFAEREKNRNVTLADKGLISVQLLETTDAAHKQDQAAVDAADALYRQGLAEIDAVNAQIDQAHANLKIDETNLGFTSIYAPMSGTVVAITARVGQTLNATQQAPVIMRIANIDTMTVWAKVSEADVQRIRAGMDAYFTLLGESSKRWNGTLREIQPTPEIVNNVVLYDALIDVPNPEHTLKVQMTAQVFFVLARSDTALLLPVAALQFGEQGQSSRSGQEQVAGVGRRDGTAGGRGPGTGGGAGGGRGGGSGRGRNNNALARTVLIFANGQVERRPVTLGVMNRVSAEVLVGIEEGERVVVGIRAPGSAGSGRGQGGGQGGGQGRGQP